MKKFIVALLFAIASFGANAHDNVFAACKAVKIPCDYRARYDFIDLLETVGKKRIIPNSTNPYINEESVFGTAYIGLPLQNEILARNIVRNKKLFVHGRVSYENMKKWVRVP